MIVGRHINGITINDLEYILDDDGDVMEFDGKEEAIAFLKDHGVTDQDIEYLVFLEKCPVCGEFVSESELAWTDNILCCDSCDREMRRRW